MKLKNYFFILVAILLIQACSKKDETPAAVTKTTLISKTWLVTTATVSPAIPGIGSNLLAGATACDLDDITVFNANASYTIEEGATKCNASDPQVYERGTWRFINNETQLETTETGGTPVVANLTELSANRMVQTATEVLNGITYTITFTYTPR